MIIFVVYIRSWGCFRPVRSSFIFLRNQFLPQRGLELPNRGVVLETKWRNSIVERVYASQCKPAHQTTCKKKKEKESITRGKAVGRDKGKSGTRGWKGETPTFLAPSETTVQTHAWQRLSSFYMCHPGCSPSSGRFSDAGAIC